jgi:hypothetical protein
VIGVDSLVVSTVGVGVGAGVGNPVGKGVAVGGPAACTHMAFD